MFITSTRGKLEVLQKHYQLLSKMSVDSEFDADWKEEVEDSVDGYSSVSEEAGDVILDKDIEKVKLQSVFENLKITKLVVVME